MRCERCGAALNPARAVTIRKKAGRYYDDGCDPMYSRRVHLGVTCYVRWMEIGRPADRLKWSPWEHNPLLTGKETR